MSFSTPLYRAIDWIRREPLLFTVLAISLLAQCVNLFGFPAYREDEGTYMSQAWAIVREGRLAPYTYWYDHAPAGWILLSGWNALMGPLFDTDVSVNLGRIFMALLTVVSTYFVYAIARTMTNRRDVAALAALLFALTPLSIVFHRRVLLDNILVFWFLISLYLLTKRPRLTTMMFSGLSFAFAMLSKESAIAFLPALLCLVVALSHKNNRHFSIVTWLSIAGLMLSFYPLFALLSGEFFPFGTRFGGTEPHVSLIDALKFHLNRDGGFFLDPGSSLRIALGQWMRYGAPFLITGLIATVWSLLQPKRRWPFFIALFSVSYMLFMLRGQVLDWYIIPLIPLFSLSIAVLAGDIIQKLPAVHRLRPSFALAIVGALLLVPQLAVNHDVFSLKQTANQVLAIEWAKTQLPKEKILLIDNYAFVDFNPHVGDIRQASVQYYWKVDTDPQIKYDVLGNNWNSIDYLLWTPAITRSIYSDNLELVKEAYEKSHIIKRFNLYNVRGEGYPVEIREVNNNSSTIREGWRHYRETFITPAGRVIDHASDSQTTSEGQSYALLRAVWENDQETYDRVLAWTVNNLKVRDAHLFSWLARGSSADNAAIEDYATASDADEDIALSLLFAHKRWKDARYLDLAKRVINDIWTYEVTAIGGTHYLLSSANAEYDEGYLINPSYFSPASYRLFAAVDPAHPWEELADDVYRIVGRLQDSGDVDRPAAQLIPNWIIVNRNGDILPANSYIHPDAEYYGYDAFRIYWRIALDAVWFDTPEAHEALEASSEFFQSEWETKRQIHSLYTVDGEPVVPYEDISTNAGALSVFLITEPELAIDLYSEKFWPAFQKGSWGEESKYYNQNWGWFATALYANNLPNLWSEQDNLAKR